MFSVLLQCIGLLRKHLCKFPMQRQSVISSHSLLLPLSPTPGVQLIHRYHQQELISNVSMTNVAQEFENYFINLNWADKPGDRFLI